MIPRREQETGIPFNRAVTAALIVALLGASAAFLLQGLGNGDQPSVFILAEKSSFTGRRYGNVASAGGHTTTGGQAPNAGAGSNQTSPLDCWTQNRPAMAGAQPCRSEGRPVPGNAKVALLFLVTEEIHTEPIWAAFLASAGELSLRQRVAPTQPSAPDVFAPVDSNDSYIDAECWKFGWSVPLHYPAPTPHVERVPRPVENATDWIHAQCGRRRSGHSLYVAQDLFTMYVHRKKGVPVAAADSVFAGRDIHHRIDTQYAEPSLVLAHRALLAAALEDPRNTMFVLVSESCIPLYHPALLWAQLLAESHVSRVAQGLYDTMRWHGNMHTDHLWGMHFRKSSQWSSLTRMHALLATQDEHVWLQFAQFCRTLEDCDVEGQSRLCIADEHYLPTMLAVYDMTQSVDRLGRLTYTNWAAGGWHPETFYPGDATTHIARMRTVSEESMCPWGLPEAMRTAASLFNYRMICDPNWRDLVQDPPDGQEEVQNEHAEAPQVEAPQADVPRVEAPRVEAPRVEAPRAEAPQADVGGRRRLAQRGSRQRSLEVSSRVEDAPGDVWSGGAGWGEDSTLRLGKHEVETRADCGLAYESRCAGEYRSVVSPLLDSRLAGAPGGSADASVAWRGRQIMEEAAADRMTAAKASKGKVVGKAVASVNATTAAVNATKAAVNATTAEDSGAAVTATNAVKAEDAGGDVTAANAPKDEDAGGAVTAANTPKSEHAVGAVTATNAPKEEDAGEAVIVVNTPKEDNGGEEMTAANAPKDEDAGEAVITANTPKEDDAGEAAVAANTPKKDDAGEEVANANAPKVENAGEDMTAANAPKEDNGGKEMTAANAAKEADAEEAVTAANAPKEADAEEALTAANAPKEVDVGEDVTAASAPKADVAWEAVIAANTPKEDNGGEEMTAANAPQDEDAGEAAVAANTPKEDDAGEEVANANAPKVEDTGEDMTAANAPKEADAEEAVTAANAPQEEDAGAAVTATTATEDADAGDEVTAADATEEEDVAQDVTGQEDPSEENEEDQESRPEEEKGEVIAHVIDEDVTRREVVLPPDEAHLDQWGPERDAHDLKWSHGIREEMRANLRAQGWLGEFEPMYMHCPLFARKVAKVAVPQFAAVAWRCDGLGFSWSCLGADPT